MKIQDQITEDKTNFVTDHPFKKKYYYLHQEPRVMHCQLPATLDFSPCPLLVSIIVILSLIVYISFTIASFWPLPACFQDGGTHCNPTISEC